MRTALTCQSGSITDYEADDNIVLAGSSKKNQQLSELGQSLYAGGTQILEPLQSLETHYLLLIFMAKLTHGGRN